MSAMSGDDGGAFSACLSKAMDLIARCRYAEMMGVTGNQSDKKNRDILIHTIFERSPTGSLERMLDHHKIQHVQMDVSKVYDALHLETDDQKLVMLFIAVVNACREQMYMNKDFYFKKVDKGLEKFTDTVETNFVKPEKFIDIVENEFDEAKLKVDDITRVLVKNDMFAYLRTAKELNQLRNILTSEEESIFEVQRTEQRLKASKDYINAAMEANCEYGIVKAEVLKMLSLTDNEQAKLEQRINSTGGLGFSNLAQFCHIVWTSFWKIRCNRTLGEITTQTIRLLGIVPQLLMFPGIVSEKEGLSWFADGGGSLPEFFGVGKDSRLLEELIGKLYVIVEKEKSSIHQEKESQTTTKAVRTLESVSELPGDGGCGGESTSNKFTAVKVRVSFTLSNCVCLRIHIFIRLYAVHFK